MLLAVLVISIAAADSINPSTVLPSLLYAMGQHPRRDIAAFAAGVFSVSTAGGLVLVFGPGRALLRVISHPSSHVIHLVTVGAGVLLLAGGAFLWLTRARVARRLSEDRRPSRGDSAFLVGAGIMAAELPTAAPYFGALVAITEGGHGAIASAALVVAYNLVFVAPLLAILVVVAVAGERGARLAARWREWLIDRGPAVAAVGLAVLGVVLIAIGAL